MTLAASRHSEDPGSKYKGGCYPNINRGQFVPEFEAAVFDTPIGDLSLFLKRISATTSSASRTAAARCSAPATC